MELKDFLVKPVKTEKSLAGEKTGKYVFLVRPQANKDVLKTEMEKFFKVKIVRMNTLKDSFTRKYLSRYRRTIKGPELKKVVVTLASGQTLSEAATAKEVKKGAGQ